MIKGMNQTTPPRPNAFFARLVLILALLTALITLAAALLFLIAILPIPPSLRLWIGLGLFIFTGVAATYALLRRARSGNAAIRQQLDELLGPLGLSLQEHDEQTGTYTGVYQGSDLRAAYAISGAPQRPTYHLEIAVHGATPLRLAIGMTKVRLQFDETQFGQLLGVSGSGFEPLRVYTDAPDATQALLARPRVRAAILDLLSPDAPGVRNLTLADDVLTLRFRHLSLKGVSRELVRAWVDDLATIAGAKP